MAAIWYDIWIDEARDNNLTFQWFDSNDTAVDVTAMGCIAEIVDADGTSISRVTDEGDIDLQADGVFTIKFPRVDLETLDKQEYYYEVIFYSNSGFPEQNPIALLKGLAKPRKKRASLV